MIEEDALSPQHNPQSAGIGGRGFLRRHPCRPAWRKAVPMPTVLAGRDLINTNISKMSELEFKTMIKIY